MSVFQPVLNEKEQKLEKEFDKLDFYYANGEYLVLFKSFRNNFFQEFDGFNYPGFDY